MVRAWVSTLSSSSSVSCWPGMGGGIRWSRPPGSSHHCMESGQGTSHPNIGPLLIVRDLNHDLWKTKQKIKTMLFLLWFSPVLYFIFRYLYNLLKYSDLQFSVFWPCIFFRWTIFTNSPNLYLLEFFDIFNRVWICFSAACLHQSDYRVYEKEDPLVLPELCTVLYNVHAICGIYRHYFFYFLI